VPWAIRASRSPTGCGTWTGYIDADGRRIELPSDEPDRAVTVITRADERIGALVHDPALREEPGLLDAVCAAAGLAMENERLHAEVLARLAEVSASRSRIVEAADASVAGWSAISTTAPSKGW